MKNKEVINFARTLRKNMTASEELLWSYIRKKQLNGYRFLRQYPVVYYTDKNGKQYNYVLDFYCDKVKLAIELDGKIHQDQLEYDKNRDTILLELGIDTLRINNEELKDIILVLDKIVARIDTLLGNS